MKFLGDLPAETAAHLLHTMLQIAYFSATQKLSVSDTAEHGDNAGGPRIITDETRCEMRKMLKEIQDGTYAKKWIAENDAGRPWFKAAHSREQEHPLEKVGSQLRAMMSRDAASSILWPIPGATESSTVEWQMAHVRPTELSLAFWKKPTTPRTAFCLINCNVTAGSSRLTLPFLIASTTDGESAPASTFNPRASAWRGVSVLIA